MSEQRPFRDAQELFDAADRTWWNLSKEDWLEAFRSHPKIGERKAARASSEQSSNWSEEEQAGARDSSRESLDELAELNRRYEEKFGHIFIICATGKTGNEMLAALRERMSNDEDTELRIAAEEQRLITRLRLEKLLNR